MAYVTTPSAPWTPSLGAVATDAGATFRVWAPDAVRVDVLVERDGYTVAAALSRRADGTFTGWQPALPAGARYRLSVDDGPGLPDPASRWQPDGVHGASAFVDPADFAWTDTEWRGVTCPDLVIYELHVGTFTPAGTFAGVELRLGYLAALGITAIELMPIAESAGTRNWGYDGVALFAPSHHYGSPDDLRRLVNAAHMHGIAVILDVVYNHLGPDGAYLSAYCTRYFSDRHVTAWGDAVNLDGEGSEHVRGFFIENALHWIHEYHVDGLRLDATHALMDTSAAHFLSELGARVRSAVSRPVLLIAEDERNLATILQPPPRGYGFDGAWADDFHHQLRVALTGDCDGYFADFSGAAEDLATTIRDGWFYTGQPAPRTGRHRGSDSVGLAPSQFVFCLQNHDQVGNRAFGDRLHHRVDLRAYRAASTLLLCLPQTPLLFMGQEWAASTPFLYFTDHEPSLGRLVTEGRRQEFAAFDASADPATRATIPDPQDRSTFDRSRLAWGERARRPHAGVARLYSELLQLRRTEAAFTDQTRPVEAFAADPDTIVMRRGPWVLAVRLRGAGTVHTSAGKCDTILTSDDAAFCDGGTPPEICGDGEVIHFHGPAAVVLKQR